MVEKDETCDFTKDLNGVGRTLILYYPYFYFCLYYFVLYYFDYRTYQTQSFR